MRSLIESATTPFSPSSPGKVRRDRSASRSLTGCLLQRHPLNLHAGRLGRRARLFAVFACDAVCCQVREACASTACTRANPPVRNSNSLPYNAKIFEDFAPHCNT